MRTRTIDLFEFWHPYWNWECVMNGMWDSRRNDRQRIASAKAVLSTPDKCREAMTGAIEQWPISAQQHLSKVHTNRRPWLGQAACAFAVDATEEETRLAWNFHMTREAQDSANDIADELIAEWERQYA